MLKVSVVGAGNVGATIADVIAWRGFAGEVTLLDIKDGVAEGKAMDMMQRAHLMGFNTRIVGSTNDYSKTAGSSVVVITSGIPRKPGMTREELIGTNAKIVKGVMDQAMEYSPNAIFVIVSNPMDTMTYLALRSSKLMRNRVIGMGGRLDTARFRYYLGKALHCAPTDVDGMVIGGHGDTTMIPLVRFATYKGIPVSQLLDKETIDKIVADTMVGGATITKLVGTSAWYAPGVAGASIVEAIVTNSHKLIPCCVALDGEYGEKDVCIGVPVVLGKDGVEKIIDVKLNKEEQALFSKSVQAVRATNALLGEALPQ